ncbi:MAG: hypothetical protein MZV64_23290 [Ignavibacteriales bacterium]|nr:hypothetical protein [Ignavibacteriales bacterium]
MWIRIHSVDVADPAEGEGTTRGARPAGNVEGSRTGGEEARHRGDGGVEGQAHVALPCRRLSPNRGDREPHLAKMALEKFN